MKSALPYHLPPHFDVERLLDDLFPERVLARFYAADGMDFFEEDIDAAINRILAAEQDRIKPLCRHCFLRYHPDCSACDGAAC